MNMDFFRKLFNKLHFTDVFHRDTSKLLIEHINELEKIEAIPKNWYWQRDNLDKIKSIYEDIIKDLKQSNDTERYSEVIKAIKNFEKELNFLLSRNNTNDKKIDYLNNVNNSIKEYLEKLKNESGLVSDSLLKMIGFPILEYPQETILLSRYHTRLYHLLIYNHISEEHHIHRSMCDVLVMFCKYKFIDKETVEDIIKIFEKFKQPPNNSFSYNLDHILINDSLFERIKIRLLDKETRRVMLEIIKLYPNQITEQLFCKNNIYYVGEHQYYEDSDLRISSENLEKLYSILKQTKGTLKFKLTPYFFPAFRKFIDLVIIEEKILLSDAILLMNKIEEKCEKDEFIYLIMAVLIFLFDKTTDTYNSSYRSFFVNLDKNDWGLIINDLIELIRISGANARYLFEDALLACLPIIDNNSWNDLVLFVKKELGNSKNKIRIFSEIKYYTRAEYFWSFNINYEKQMCFKNIFLYFLRYKRKSLIQFIRNVSLIHNLGLFINKDFFFKISKPLVFMDDNELNQILSQKDKSSVPYLLRLYDFLTKVNQSKKRSDFDKLYNSLSDKIRREKAKEELSKIFADELFKLFEKKIKSGLNSLFQELGIYNIDTSLIDDLFIESYKMFKKTTLNKVQSEEMLKEYLNKNMYPNKRLFKSYPFTREENIIWLKKHGFRGVFSRRTIFFSENKGKIKLLPEDFTNPNSIRVKHHLEEANRLVNQLGTNYSFNESNFEKFNPDISSFSDKQKNIYKDLKLQLNSLKAFQNSTVNSSKLKEIIIYRERNPLRVLMMGNWMNGSCLSFYSTVGNFYSAFTNALEVNKAVFYLENESNEVVARVLVAIDNNNKILRFPTYYNIQGINFDRVINVYLSGLAKKCNLKVDGEINKVQLLFCDKWYTDPEIKINE